MEKEIIGEQPEKEPANNEIEVSVESDSGSPNDDSCNAYGKFKTPEALLEAYNNLQAEFTRKCQKLSEFEKEKTVEKNLSEDEINDGLSKFLEKNSDAKNYSEQLVEKVREEKSRDPFENAWAEIIKEKFSGDISKKESDPLIKKYIFDDEELTNKVIECYMKDLNTKKPPIVLSADSGQRVALQEPTPPTNLAQAKKIVEEMFS